MRIATDKPYGESRVILSSGRAFYAYGGVLGLHIEDDGLEPSSLLYGFDGSADGPDGDLASAEKPKFTPEERREIAEHMINAWKK